MLALCLSKGRLVAFGMTLAWASPSLAGGPKQSHLDIPPRLQWMANYGYCGEVALLSAGLYYGQYVSQYDARALATPGVPQNLEESQLLLSENDELAASNMRLKSVVYQQPDRPDAHAFLSWVRAETGQGHPVSIGVYMNQQLFYGRGGNAGFVYDHIVPVTGVDSHWPLDDQRYHADDVLHFSDSGLWSPEDTPPYHFAMSFASVPLTRRQANTATAPVYSVTSTHQQYGIAITGVADDDGVTLPVRLQMQENAEPALAEGASARPPAAMQSMVVTVSGLRPGVDYRLYRYDDFAKVPTSHFNAAAAHAREVLRIRIAEGSTFAVARQSPTNETVIFRAVPASAP